jgi:hypothetical protein
VAVSKTPWQEIRVLSGRDDKLVALKLPIIQWMHARPCLNKFVISTGAQRSGEICGFFFSLCLFADFDSVKWGGHFFAASLPLVLSFPIETDKPSRSTAFL